MDGLLLMKDKLHKPGWLTRFEYDAEVEIKYALEGNVVNALNIIHAARYCIEHNLDISEPVAQYLSKAAIAIHGGTDPDQAFNLKRKKGQRKTPGRMLPDEQKEIGKEMEDDLKELQQKKVKAPYDTSAQNLGEKYNISPETVKKYYKDHMKTEKNNLKDKTLEQKKAIVERIIKQSKSKT